MKKITVEQVQVIQDEEEDRKITFRYDPEDTDGNIIIFTEITHIIQKMMEEETCIEVSVKGYLDVVYAVKWFVTSRLKDTYQVDEYLGNIYVSKKTRSVKGVHNEQQTAETGNELGGGRQWAGPNPRK